MAYHDELEGDRQAFNGDGESMKLSTRARYALRMMVVFARRSDGNGVVSLNQVSEETLISRRYLEQLAIGLKHTNLIRGRSGRGGGYALARPAGEITMREIIESAIGPINIVECVFEPENCPLSDLCECRLLYGLINKRITSVLDNIVLADLVEGNRLKKIVMALDAELMNSLPGEEGRSSD